MSEIIKKDDLRVKKTTKVLADAMLSLLQSRHFRSISVNELCEEASVSRSTFYVYFDDKYSLLQYSLNGILSRMLDGISTRNESDAILIVNGFVSNNRMLIKNLFVDADEITQERIQVFMEALIGKILGYEAEKLVETNHMALLKFCAGGLVSLLKWQEKNKFPPNVQFLNEEVFQIIKGILE